MSNPFSQKTDDIKIKNRFRRMPYLVEDFDGNFFVVEHCPYKRTIPFKQLDSSRGYVYYHGNMVRMPTLRKRAIEQLNTLET